METNTSTRCLLAVSILLSAATANAASDPAAAIADCRAKYAEQPSEHVACLERELQALSTSRQKSTPAVLGEEQLRNKRAPDAVEEVSVQIANVSYGFDGTGLFRMADGQVWKGTESTPREQRLAPGKTYSARIERGKLGGYRMYVEGVPRMIKVMRTQ